MTRARLAESFGYAFSGIAEAFRVGRNFKVQTCVAVLAVALGLVFGISPAEWALVVVCIGCVLGGECMNTAIEAVVDLASPERHELAKRAKDCAAGAVLLCSFASLAVGAFIFLPRILQAFTGVALAMSATPLH